MRDGAGALSQELRMGGQPSAAGQLTRAEVHWSPEALHRRPKVQPWMWVSSEQGFVSPPYC